MRSLILFFTLLVCSQSLFGQRQDTIKVMHYNLLNYRNITNQCNAETNNPEDKDKALDRIIWYTQPDIFTVNEMGSNWLNPSKLLSNALNKSGEIEYDQAEFTNNGFSSLVNMLFFNKAKFALESQKTISKDEGGSDLVRVIDVYRLFVKDSEALSAGDTLFFNVIVAHLKAGSTSADKTERAAMTKAIMTFLKNKRSTENYIICGDFNIQTHSEECYQTLTVTPEEDFRFYDPVDAPGSWNNKSLYANLHTQSTRTTSTQGGCFSGGGMDDRFDFILVGKEILDNKNKAKYIKDSYKALGQDSRRFNGTILNPANKSVPSSVSQALYNMSDHLPIILEIEIGPVFASAEEIKFANLKFHLEGHTLRLWGESLSGSTARIYSSNGVVVAQNNDLAEVSREINLDGNPKGIYILELQQANGTRITKRFALVED